MAGGGRGMVKSVLDSGIEIKLPDYNYAMISISMHDFHARCGKEYFSDFY
jgi:hypothetical protein